MGGVVHKEHDGAFEHAVFAVEVYRAHVYFEVAGDDFGDFVDDANVVDADDFDAGKEGELGFAGPLCFYDAVGVVAHEVDGVGTIDAVNFDAFVDGDEAEYVIARDGIAAR